MEAIRHLKDSLPLAGIGAYIKQKERNFSQRPPCFLIIRNIDENEKGEPRFDIHFMARMEEITSLKLLDKTGTRDLFFNVSQDPTSSIISHRSILQLI